MGKAGKERLRETQSVNGLKDVRDPSESDWKALLVVLRNGLDRP
jgi:hypothetical protein